VTNPGDEDIRLSLKSKMMKAMEDNVCVGTSGGWKELTGTNKLEQESLCIALHQSPTTTQQGRKGLNRQGQVPKEQRWGCELA
jgi:hypothetical protein